MTETATTTDHVSTFTRRADRFTTVLDAAGGAWDGATPCEGWTVRDVVAHVIDTQREFLGRQDLPTGPEPDLSDPAAAWRSHRAHVEQVLDSPGVAEHEYDGFFGRTTIGATVADFYGWDLVIHGWDVARATAQPWTIGDEEAASMHATADGWGDALYAEGICRPAVQVAGDAPATDRLVARLGRDPQWEPGA